MHVRLFALALLAAPLWAQSASHPHFAAATIKPSGPDSRPRFSITPGRLQASKISLRRALYMAYHVLPFDIAGGPSWVDDADFDMNASLDEKDVAAQPGAQHDQVMQAWQDLLEERFQLVLRREQKVQPVFLLTVARSGFKLKDGEPLPDSAGQGFGNATTSRIVRRGVPLSDLTYSLSGLLEQHVVDRTGLTGTYSFALEWQKEQQPNGMMGATAGAVSAALRDQLGLNMESGKALVDMIVIERAEKPSAN